MHDTRSRAARLGIHPVTSASDVQDLIWQYHPGEKISIGWDDRVGQPRIITVQLTSGPAN